MSLKMYTHFEYPRFQIWSVKIFYLDIKTWMLFTGVEENKYQMFQLNFCSIFALFTFVLCQLRNVYRSKWSIASGIRKLNGEIEPCRIDCLSYDLCVAGAVNCTTIDGRTAMCKWVIWGLVIEHPSFLGCPENLLTHYCPFEWHVKF